MRIIDLVEYKKGSWSVEPEKGTPSVQNSRRNRRGWGVMMFLFPLFWCGLVATDWAIHPLYLDGTETLLDGLGSLVLTITTRIVSSRA